MAFLRLALAQYDFPVGAVAANMNKISQLMEQARAGGAALVMFPELTLSGYPPEDLLLRPSFLAACQQAVQDLADKSHGLATLVGHPYAEDGRLYNAASVLCEGSVQQRVYKQQLPNYGVFDDKRYFHAGHASAVTDIEGIRLGLLICEDIWAPGPAADAARRGAELLLVINASPWNTVKKDKREATLATRARETGCAIAYVNMVGGQDEVVYDGASLLINSDGSVAARAPAFVDALWWARFDAESRTLHAENWPVVPPPCVEETLYAALVRGIRDYVDKNGFPGVLLGLSGGIDSALSLALAVDALGPARVTAVMLPSHYTSGLSLEGAKAQAQRLGVAYHVIPIEPTVAAFLEALQPVFAGKGADTTEENLQSRVRGTMLMALSNKHGRLLLATGNKSEMAVGYATLYGDMCGAYAPLKDVYKSMVYRLAAWRNKTAEQAAQQAVIPLAVIERPPSAELRDNQTDQDSLPAYDALDAILRHFIEEDLAQNDIVALGYAPDMVRKVTSLVLANEFKRRQAAPGPRVSTRAFGRERRYPITSAWR